jgi:hypothetical protein
MDGADVLERMRSVSSLRDVPAVIVTGDYFIDEGTIERLRGLGAWIRFKPLWLDDMVTLADELTRTSTAGSAQAVVARFPCAPPPHLATQ